MTHVGSAGARGAAQDGPVGGGAEAPPALPRDLHAMLGDGVAFSLMVGLGETYVPAFALAAGLGAVTSGLVATLPMLAGATLQLVTPAGVERLGSYRRWVVASATLQAASFAPLVIGGVGAGITRTWLFAAMTVYWGAGMATGPAWNAWVGALVPLSTRARFFARRSLACQAALLAGILAAGLYLERAAAPDDPLFAFGWLFAAAAGFRLISATFLARQSEPAGLVQRHRRLSSRGTWRAVRGSEGRRVLLYLLGMQVAVQICAPYFTAYMLGPLALSYGDYMTLTATAFASRVVVLPLFGRLAHARGSRVLFRMGALGIVPLPSLWLVSDDLHYLIALQLLSGAIWAALELATLLSFFETLEERDRTSILTAFNFGSAVAMAAGTLVGAALFSAFEPGRAVYALLFLASSLARLFVLIALPRPRPATHVPADVSLRTLAVRPAAGAIQRPVLPTLSAEDAREEGASS